MPDRQNRKKRTKLIILSPTAFDVWKELRTKSPTWDFSNWISHKLVAEFKVDNTTHLLAKIKEMQSERDAINERFDVQLRGLVSKLNEERDKERRREERCAKYPNAEVEIMT